MHLDKRVQPSRHRWSSSSAFTALLPLMFILLGSGRSLGQESAGVAPPEKAAASAPAGPPAAAPAASAPAQPPSIAVGAAAVIAAILLDRGLVVHAWSPLTQPPQAPFKGSRTALYTYVLVGDVGVVSGAPVPSRVSNARAALAELLAVVQAGQKALTIRDRDLLLRANQYLVPAPASHTDRVTLSVYDFELASQYLNVMRVALAEHDFAERMSSTGPFLIALRKPLPEFAVRGNDGRLRVDTDSPVLFIDVSDAHPKSMPAYVTAFTEAVRTELPADSSELRPLRPAFASALLRASEALPFVAEAFAGSRKLFPGN